MCYKHAQLNPFPDMVEVSLRCDSSAYRNIEMVFVVNNDWKQKYIQTIFTTRCYRNRVQLFVTAGSPNLNMVGLIVVPFQLVVSLMLVL